MFSALKIAHVYKVKLQDTLEFAFTSSVLFALSDPVKKIEELRGMDYNLENRNLRMTKLGLRGF